MKNKFVCLTAFLMCSSSYAESINNRSPAPTQLGYSYGYVMGRSNAEILKDINLDAFMQGLKQGSSGKTSNLTDEEMAKALTQYKKQTDAQQLEEFKKVAALNAQKGAAFLSENAKLTGVTTTKSGLQYQVIKTGQGQKPRPDSKVEVNYEGRLLDGTVFDSSIARNQSVEFQVSQVIQGWTEGLQLMQEGAKFRFFIPSQLAYGEIGSGDAIAPNSTLIFDVELIKVLP